MDCLVQDFKHRDAEKMSRGKKNFRNLEHRATEKMRKKEKRKNEK
jgi:hypothetical protein